MPEQGDPYRSPAETCGFCGAHIEGGGGALCDALPLCPTCDAGQLDRGLARWGFEYSDSRYLRTGSQMACAMEIRRPSELFLVAKIYDETVNRKILKAFGRKELEVGGDFDQQAFIEADEEYQALLDLLLDREGVREAILSLLRLGGRDKRDNCVDLTMRLVGAVITWPRDRREPDPAEVRKHLVALAVHVETFARERTAGSAGPGSIV